MVIEPFKAYAIRKHIYEYYLRGEHPTLKKLQVSLREEGIFEYLFNMNILLKNIGFEVVKHNGRQMVVETEDNLLGRCRFMQKMPSQDLSNVVWVGECFITINQESGVPKNYILCHASTSAGFIQDGLLVTEPKGNKFRMGHKTFHKWFNEQLLPNIGESRTIVMDSASSRTVQTNKLPNEITPKAEIIEWLQKKNVATDSSMLRGELFGLVMEQEQKHIKTYYLDEIAAQKGHTIVRIPHFHYHFNPMEKIWFAMKIHVAEIEKVTGNVEDLLREAVEQVVDQWDEAVESAKVIIETTRELELKLDDTTEDLLYNIKQTQF